jgi:hypothetical protein
VKKCVQCTKDLPDAALHCVFCGSKQPAQAPPAELARTVMGYSANQVRDQLAAQQAAAQPGPQADSRAHSPSTPPPMSFGAPASPPVPFNQAPSYRPPPSPVAATPPPSFQQPPAYQPPAAAPYPQPSAPAFPPPVAANAATMFVPSAGRPEGAGPLANPGHPASGPSGSGPSGPSGGGYGGPMVPAVPSSAKTMAAPSPVMHPNNGYFPPSGGGGQMSPSPAYVPPPASSPYQPPAFVAPSAYQPVPVPQSPPYLASQTADRPIDPYRDGLRLVLFTFGILLLGAFCTPTTSSPLAFNWSVLTADLPIAAKLPSLIIAVVGALSIIVASPPLATAPRGLLAALIALLGIATPIALAKGFGGGWRPIVAFAAPFLLVPGLLLRQEYRESFLPRLLVTLGVLALLALMLVPVGGALPLVAQVKQVVDAAGTAKVSPLLDLVFLVLVVLTLLVWLPAPASAGAKLFAWILLFWPAIEHFQGLILSENLGETVKASPFTAVMSWVPAVAYLAIFSYGLAALLGKRLENA